MRKLIVTTALVFLAAAAAPAKASADWLFTPFVGFNWGGSASFGDFGDFDDEFEKRADFGASLAYMGAGAVGFEIDFGWAPNFFENTVGNGDFEFGDNNVTTLMANLTLGAPIGGQHGAGVRPYASGGLGIIKIRADHARDLFNVDNTDWGFNVGAGVMGFFTDNVGLRGDVRYFRSLQDNESDDSLDIALSDFHFWRGSVGLTFRF
jgi:opacity protein-like surface antigen